MSIYNLTIVDSTLAKRVNKERRKTREFFETWFPDLPPLFDCGVLDHFEIRMRKKNHPDVSQMSYFLKKVKYPYKTKFFRSATFAGNELDRGVNYEKLGVLRAWVWVNRDIRYGWWLL